MKHITGEETKQTVFSCPDIVFNNMLDVLLVMGVDAKIVITNSASRELLAYSEEELVGRPLGEILAEDGIELFNIIKTIISKGFVKNRSLTCVTRDGEKIPVAFSGSGMRNQEGDLVGIVGIIKDMRDINKLLHDLEKSRDSLEIKVEERTADLANAKELIEEAYNDLKETQAQLLQSEKMASVGQLAAGVAHEINNPIGFIYSNLGSLGEYIVDLKDMLGKFEALLDKAAKSHDAGMGAVVKDVNNFKDEIDLDFILDDLSNIIVESREGVSRVKKIVDDLKVFSHISEAKLKYADINRGLESTLNIVSNELKYVATVKKDLGDVPEIKCFPQQLNQVFMNLLINASQAIEGKGEIGLKTYKEGDNIFIEISDTGCGIPKEKIERIFEPFFTTKPVGLGTGLGLSVSYRIIEKHGGHISVESKEGKGTTFTIGLPLN